MSAFLNVVYALIVANGGTVPNGGDYLREKFDYARSEAAARVAMLNPCSFNEGSDAESRRWLLENGPALAEDIQQSEHAWINEEQATCGQTLLTARSPIQFSFRTCARSDSPRAILHLLIHESIHHFGLSDEKRVDDLAAAVIDARFAAYCPLSSQAPIRRLKGYGSRVYVQEGDDVSYIAGSDKTKVARIPGLIDFALAGDLFCSMTENSMQCQDENGTPTNPPPDLSKLKFGFAPDIASDVLGPCAMDQDGVKCLNGLFLPTVAAQTFLTTGDHELCYLEFGQVHCLGFDGGSPRTLDFLKNPTEIAANGWSQACAVEDRGVACWMTASEEPFPIEGLTLPHKLKVSSNFQCALDQGGLYCWNFTPDSKVVAKQILRFEPADYAASADGICYRKDADSDVKCISVNTTIP